MPIQRSPTATHRDRARGVRSASRSSKAATPSEFSLSGASSRSHSPRVRSRARVHIPDVFVEPGYDWPANIEQGVHTVAAVPIFSAGEVVGAIGAGRFRVEPYTAEELRLFETFADQAGIAIENVRLFNETKESLERQTAVSEILRVISESPTEIQPVLDAIASNAVRY